MNEDDFRSELESLIPQLRAFARSLCGRRDMADDLVQDTLLKAWSARGSFRAGTTMRAWTFIILRNVFLSRMRRARFKGEWNEESAEQHLAAPAAQEKQLQLSDLQRALMCLPPPQRVALILVGAGGLAYEEVATICGCAVGTVKSRVARARAAVEKRLADGTCPARASCPIRAGAVGAAMFEEVDQIVGRAGGRARANRHAR
ncbi:MAG: sigma-70 family RNA polymerase sigma factor [Alphaproteobacteria bacterium]